MSLLARLCVATFFILSCICCARAASQSGKLRESGGALIDSLRASRKQAMNGGVNLAQQQIQNPRHAGVPPAEEGASLLQLSRVFYPRLLSCLLPHGVSDLKPGGRAGPPDETTVFLNMLPVVIPCIFLVAILIVVIALRYFNAIAEQTPEGERMFCLVVCCACVVSSRTLFASRISPLNVLQRHISMQT